jgi:hypothetical protein
MRLNEAEIDRLDVLKEAKKQLSGATEGCTNPRAFTNEENWPHPDPDRSTPNSNVCKKR